MQFAFNIGGEFPVKLPTSTNVATNQPAFELWSSGRSALMAILTDIQRLEDRSRAIFVPNYICESVVSTIKGFGLKIVYYHINDDLGISFDEKCWDLISDGDVVLLVSYFGIVNVQKSIVQLKAMNKYVVVIQDDVQAYWEFQKPSEAEYQFTSLRKSFPIPEGGLIKTKSSLNVDFLPLPVNRFYPEKYLGGILKGLGYDHNLFLNLLRDGENLIDTSNAMERASSLASTLYTQISISEMGQRRVANADVVQDYCDRYSIEQVASISSGSVPLFVPVFVDDRDALKVKLFEYNIFLPHHWPAQTFSDIPTDMRLRSNELSIVIDHRYSQEEIAYMMECIVRIRNK